MWKTMEQQQYKSIETGLLDLETISHKQKRTMDYRLKNSTNQRDQRPQELSNSEESNSWKAQTEQSKEKHEITKEELQGKNARNLF